MDLNDALLAQKTMYHGSEERAAALLVAGSQQQQHQQRRKRQRGPDVTTRPSASTVDLPPDQGEGESIRATPSPPPEADAAAAVRAVAASAHRALVLSNLIEHVFTTALGGRHNAARETTLSGGPEPCRMPLPLALLVEQAVARPAAFLEIVHVASRHGCGSDALSTVASNPVALAVGRYRAGLHLMSWQVDAGCGATIRGSHEQKAARMEQALIALQRGKAGVSLEPAQPAAAAAADPVRTLYAPEDGANPTSAKEAAMSLLQCSDDDDD
jgi:hypothetical protein